MSYKDRIVKTIIGLKDRNGSSLMAIKKGMQASMPSRTLVNSAFVTALESAVANGELLQIKGSYKLSPEYEKALAKTVTPKKLKKKTAPGIDASGFKEKDEKERSENEEEIAFEEDDEDEISHSEDELNAKKRATDEPERNLSASDEMIRASMQLLPMDVQLKVYDTLLATRAYERRLRSLYLLERINSPAYGYEEFEEFDSREVPYNFNHLPAKIRLSYELVNYVWDDCMDFGAARIEKRAFLLPNDNTAEIELYKLDVFNDGDGWTLFFDAESLSDETGKSMEEALDVLEYYHNDDDDNENRLVQEISTADEYGGMIYSDEFTDLRSNLHQMYLSSGEKKPSSNS